MTGIGLVSSLGIGTEATWAGLCAGRSGIRKVTRFDVSAFACQIAGEVDGFDPLNYVDKKEVKKIDTFIQYAIAASDFALRDQEGRRVTMRSLRGKPPAIRAWGDCEGWAVRLAAWAPAYTGVGAMACGSRARSCSCERPTGP